MLEFIPPHVEKTLEFGCGEGAFSLLLKENYHAETWAVEIDEDSAKVASQKLHKVINEDACSCLDQIPEAYFDCIICFDILEHLVDPYSLLVALKSKLSAKGVIVTSIPNIRYYSALKKFLVHGNWDYEDQGILDRTHLRFFTHNSIVKMYASLDFDIVQMKGMHPTSSSTCKLIQIVTLNRFSDIKYKHFVNVVKPKSQASS